MQAYLNNPKLKEQVLAELQAHYDADNFIKGTYWENGKGCAVGCLLKSGNHIEYEKKYGIPVYLARLEDEIFEGLSNGEAKEWPLDFMSSFEVGKDYSNVVWDFLKWLLLEYLLPKVTEAGKIFDNVRQSLKDCAAVLGKDCTDAADAAYAALDAADAADYRSAADAAYAAYSAAAAYDAADYAVNYAVDYAADYSLDCAAAYTEFSNKLIELIKKV